MLFFVSSGFYLVNFFFILRMQLYIDVMLKQDDEMFPVLLSPKNSSCRIFFLLSIPTHIHFYCVAFILGMIG